MTELDKLIEMLDKDNICYIHEQIKFTDVHYEPTTFSSLLYGNDAECLKYFINKVGVYSNGEEVISCICQMGSYGCDYNLIEAWDFSSDPVGYLKAKEAYAMIKKMLKDNPDMMDKKEWEKVKGVYVDVRQKMFKNKI